MKYEYNDVFIRNDEQPANIGSAAIKNNVTPSEAKSVSESSERIVEEFGSTYTAGLSKNSAGAKAAAAQKISAAASSATVTASAATIVAAVVVVAVAATSGVAAPEAYVSGAEVAWYNGENIRVEFVLEDNGGELESVYAWIESGGEEITCEITQSGGVWSAEAELYEEAVGELYFVVYVSSGGGWEGELYRGVLALPSAPDIAVEYEAAYTAESGELTINFELGDMGALTSYAAHIYDSDGGEIASEVNYTSNTITATIADGSAALYLVISGETTDGWTGELYRDKITMPADGEPTDPTTPDEPTEPTAPDVAVSYTVAYTAESGVLTINFELSDTSALSSYTAGIYDSDGGEIASTVDYTSNTITATIADSSAALYLVISGETTDGWTGELYRAEIDLSALAPTVEVAGAAVSLYSGTGLTVTFTIDDPDGELAYHEAVIADASGGEAVCSLSIDGSLYAATADISALDTSGGLTLVVYVLSNTGWDGILYSGAITLPEAPTEAGYEVTYFYDGDGGELVVSYGIYDHGSELSGYTVQLVDGSGGEISGTVDEAANTLTAAVTDTSGTYIFVITATTVGGWQGEVYREEMYIPAAPELTVEVGSESSYESGAGGNVDFYPSYYSDTTDIVEFRYWIEDMNGQIYECTEDEYGIAAISFTAEDNLATNDIGEVYFVIYVITSDGWRGTVYRELQYVDYSLG